MLRTNSIPLLIQGTAITGNALADFNQRINTGSGDVRQSVMDFLSQVDSTIQFPAIDIIICCQHLQKLKESGALEAASVTEMIKHVGAKNATEIPPILQELRNSDIDFPSKQKIAPLLLENLHHLTSIETKDLQSILRLLHELELPEKEGIVFIERFAVMKITASKDFTAANLANIAYYLHTYLISEEHGSFDMAYYGILVNTGSCNANYAFKDNLERVKEDLKNKDLVTQMTAINTLGGFIKKQSYKVEAGNIIDKAPAQYHRPNDIITCFTLDLHGASFALAKELCDFFIRQREEVGDQQQYVIVPGAGNHSRTGDHGKMQQIVWNSIKTHFPGVDFKIFTRSLRTTSSLIAVNPISYKIANRNAGSSVPHSTPSSAGSAVRNNSTNAQNNYRLPYARSSSNLPSGTVGGPYSYTPVSGVGRGHPYPGTAPNPYSPYVPHGTAPNPYPPYGTPGIASNLYGANAVRNNQMNAGNIPSPNHYNYTGAAHDVAVQATARLPIGSTTQETYIATYAQIYAYHYYTLATQAGETVDYQSIYEYALNHASSFYQ